MELLRAAIARSLRPEDPAAASPATVEELAWRVREVCRVTERPLLPLDRDVLTFAQLWLTTLPELEELC